MSTLTIALLLLIPLAILTAIAGIVITHAGSINVVFFLGKFIGVYRPGLGFIVPILMWTETHSTQTHQDEHPDDPENIDRLNDIPKEGMKHPFRVLHSSKEEGLFWVPKEEGMTPSQEDLDAWEQVPFHELPEKRQEAMQEDSLHAPLTGEIAVVTEWLLDPKKEGAIQNFIENVLPENGRTREEEVRKRMEDMIGRSLQELLGPVTLGHAREMLQFFSTHIKVRLEKLIGELEQEDPDVKAWGIHLRDAYIKSIHPGRRVNEARADAAAAVSQKQVRIRNAEAARQEEIEKGIGEAGRIEAMGQVLQTPEGKFAAVLDVAEQVMPHTKPIIISGEGGAMSGILALLGANEILKGKQNSPEPVPPSSAK